MRPNCRPVAGPTRQRGQVLIALLLGALFFGGASTGSLVLFGGKTPKEMGKQIKALEPDKARRENIADVLDKIDKETKRLNSERSHLEKDTLKALERHDTTPDEFRELAARADSVNADTSKSLLDLRFMLRHQLSDSHWNALFSQERSR
jgi:hypothetical protein